MLRRHHHEPRLLPDATSEPDYPGLVHEAIVKDPSADPEKLLGMVMTEICGAGDPAKVRQEIQRRRGGGWER